MKKYLMTTALGVLLLSQNACNQEYLNPSSTSQQQVVSSSDGLITLCNGLQYRYSATGAQSVLYTAMSVGGLTTRELVVLNAGNGDEDNLSKGLGNVTNNNGVVSTLWTINQLVKSNADIILANTSVVTDAGTKSGIVGYASIFRALALGTLAQFFEQAPIQSGTNAPFVDRMQLFKEAIAQLETAAAQVASAPVSADFNSKIVPGIDIPNTIQALIARYSLFAGDYEKALTASAKVDLTKRSYFSFDDNARNPVFFYSFGNRNVTEPTNTSLGLTGDVAPAAGDKRIPFYTQTATPSRNLGTGFFTSNSAQVPVYLPGEISLIRAEAYIRGLNSANPAPNVENAIAELNKVLTKKPTTDIWGVGADLPAYSGPKLVPNILTEIYRNRAIELAYQGFRLEDSRRFGRSGPSATGERNRNFMPYPRTESDNNTNTPTNPVT